MNHQWTDEEIRFLEEHQEGRSRKEMAEMISARFGWECRIGQISGTCTRHGFRNGLDGKFQKGTPSPLKGKKKEHIPEGCRKTMFKKGHLPGNWKPVGTKVLRNIKGRKYWYIKTAEPREWRLLHQVIWEEANGPIPEGTMITFANGDSEDCRLENLMIETKAQHGVKNRYGLRGYDIETNQIMNQVADLKMAITKRKERKK